MNNKELQAETEAQQSKNAELLPSAPLVANPLLADVHLSHTAMHELLKWYIDKNESSAPGHLYDKFVELLQVEKQQVIDAFTAGQIDISNTLFQEYKERGFKGDTTIPENDKEDGIEYFNNTFY